MVRVSLPLRGIAVLLLAASTVVGQTPEPPVELFTLDPFTPSAPDFLRHFSADARHPLLALMVDGELVPTDAPAPPEASKIKPTPQTPSTPPAASKVDPPDGCLLDGCLDGCLVNGCPLETVCPTVPNWLPFACPPPPPPYCSHKCLRKGKRGYSDNYGYTPGGNPYLGWPCCPAWCFYGAPLVPGKEGCCGRGCCWRKHKRCSDEDYGYPYGYGYGGWNLGCDSFVDGGWYSWMPPPPPCNCRKCQKRSKHSYGWGYGYPYGPWVLGGDDFVVSGWCGCWVPPPPPPPCGCRKCSRKHGSSYGYGYPGWNGYYGGVGPYYAYGCGKHHSGFGLFHRCRCCQPTPPPYPCGPMPIMPYVGIEPFCADCVFAGGIGPEVVMDDIVN